MHKRVEINDIIDDELATSQMNLNDITSTEEREDI